MRGSARNYDFGQIVDPLDIILPPRRPGDPSSAYLAAKLKRRIGDGRMRRFRAVPVARRAWFVTLTATETKETDFEPGQLVCGLEYRPSQFWVHARRVARKFSERDQRHGGTGDIFPVEYRHCKVCNRILLADSARSYRERERWPIHTWQFPAGPACSVDCKPVILRNSKYRKREAA